VANPSGVAMAMVPARRYNVPIMGSNIPPLRMLVVIILKFIADKPPTPINRVIATNARRSIAAEKAKRNRTVFSLTVFISEPLLEPFL